jgi:large subunit ribosomal protein L28
MGNQITRSGSPKYKGGIGLHTGGISRRRFYPNIQTVKIVLDGKVARVGVCARCIHAGKIQRAPVRPNQLARSAEKAEKRRQMLAATEAASAAAVAQAEKERVEAEAAEAARDAEEKARDEARMKAREGKPGGPRRGVSEGEARMETLQMLDRIESGEPPKTAGELRRDERRKERGDRGDRGGRKR